MSSNVVSEDKSGQIETPGPVLRSLDRQPEPGSWRLRSVVRPVEGVSDEQLIAESAADPHAFEAVFLRHASAMHRYVARRGGSSSADDIVAETFTRAFDQRHRYRNEYADARPWLLGIATNVMRHHHRSEATRLRAYARLDPEQASDGVDLSAVSRADADAARSALSNALAKLKRGDRDALLLMAWADLSYEEIGAALEIPVGTVRSRINRARRQLREVLQDVAAISNQGRLGSGDPPEIA